MPSSYLRLLTPLILVILLAGAGVSLAARMPIAGSPLTSPAVATPAPTTTPLPPGPPNGHLRMSPEIVDVKAGDSFEVGIVLFSEEVPVRGAQTGLKFDPSVLQVTKVVEGSFFKDWASEHEAVTMMFPPPKIDNQKGTVSPVGVAIMGGESNRGPVGSGSLITYHLTAKAAVKGPLPMTLVDIEVDDAWARPFDGKTNEGERSWSGRSLPTPAPVERDLPL